jgi:hypothetical protein
MIIDSLLPFHVFSDRTIFQTYNPGRKTHTTPYGNTLVIEGIGTVVICVTAEGTVFNFSLDDCWHIPASPNNFYSCIRSNSKGSQVMIFPRSPCLLVAHQQCLIHSKLPKYFPLTKNKTLGLFTLDFSCMDSPTSSSNISFSMNQPIQAQNPYSLSLFNSTVPFTALATCSDPSPWI